MPGARVYVLGDDLQICFETRGVFNPNHYDAVLTEEQFTVDYRAAKCQKLKELKQTIRKAQRANMTEMEIYTQIVKPASKILSL